MTGKIRLMGLLTLACLLLAAPAMADTQFRIRRMTRNDVPLGKGQCDIRLQVDGEVEVSIRGDMAYIRTISGRDARDDGSECNEPLPGRAPDGFGFEVRDSRGEIRMLSEPSGRNGHSAIVRIRDNAGGEGRYHFRITWLMGDGRGGGGGFDGGRPPDIRPGGGGYRGWNDTVSFRGRGRGSYDRRGDRPRNVYEVSVNVDRGGRVIAVFNTDGGPPLEFSGYVTNMQDGVMTADLVSGDRSRGLRGAALITLDRRREVDRISMDGTADRDRFRLEWSRR
jgi:hypothetical protein